MSAAAGRPKQAHAAVSEGRGHTSARNLSASVLARLLALAKQRGDDFGLLLNRFAIERLLARLSMSTHAERFVLKGALLFALWYDTPHRPTRDADLLGFGPEDAATLGLDQAVQRRRRQVAPVAGFFEQKRHSCSQPGRYRGAAG